MKIPKKLIIGSCEYRVCRKSFDKRKNEWGECDNEKQIIWIDKNLKGHQMRFVLMHEIIHALGAFTSVGQSEEQIDALANAIICILRDNPELRRML